MGVTAIIVCLTSYVSAMANTCKQLCPIPNYASNIAEAQGMRDLTPTVVSYANRLSNNFGNLAISTSNITPYLSNIRRQDCTTASKS